MMYISNSLPDSDYFCRCGIINGLDKPGDTRLQQGSELRWFCLEGLELIQSLQDQLPVSSLTQQSHRWKTTTYRAFGIEVLQYHTIKSSEAIVMSCYAVMESASIIHPLNVLSRNDSRLKGPLYSKYPKIDFVMICSKVFFSFSFSFSSKFTKLLSMFVNAKTQLTQDSELNTPRPYTEIIMMAEGQDDTANKPVS